MLNLLDDAKGLSKNGYGNLHSYQQQMKVPVASPPHQPFAFVYFSHVGRYIVVSKYSFRFLIIFP